MLSWVTESVTTVSYTHLKSKISELELLEAIKKAKEVYDLLKSSNRADKANVEQVELSLYPAANIIY